MRRALRREITGTIGLLADEHDFRAMRRYRSFAFDDCAAYWNAVEELLKARASRGIYTTVALFDPQEYADFCADSGLAPDAPSSRTRFTAELAIMGPVIPYDGQPLSELIPVLIDETVRQATWEYASTALARLGNCATCGEDIGRAALARAVELLSRILDTARSGNHSLVCSVRAAAAPEPLISTLHAATDADSTAPLDEAEVLEFTTVFAFGLASRSPGGLVMRTTAPNTTDRACGWRFRGGHLEALTAGEVFDAYCTDIDSGDPIPPEPAVDYCAAPDLGQERPKPGHHH
ncbi:hypothetical protein AB0H82_11095 [Streptomyces sp. NPDC050732]|uniref:hypothetical protein n=1 Tax=Streptomyces sp. NPDC050732 TaxID=3154632 RepID=UPI003415A77D